MEERQSHLAESTPSDFKKLKNQKGAFNSNLSYRVISPEDQKIMMLRIGKKTPPKQTSITLWPAGNVV